ncbi:MAG: N-acetylmuramoyl-L-alanine amidase [Clostridiales bacterium]|nr:N-acetylmuramoyl-L-alanine amidase [Clostridiales bacterium]
MPSLFLSPSVQDFNPYTNGLGSEEYNMNLIADAMEPYLVASGITFTRNNPDDTLSQAIALSNAGNYDFHLALHSNAAPPSLAGQIQGPDVYYYATSTEGKRAADIFADNLKVIYPDPALVNTVPNTTLGELRLVRAPSNLIELAYHDNLEDALWIVNNTDNIARNLVLSLTEYFGIPFVLPE